MPADSFFEWQNTKYDKVLFRIMLKREELLSFEGLWGACKDKETSEVRHTFSIITTDANGLVSPIHNCMSVILSPEAEELWMDENELQEDLLSLRVPFQANEMKADPVSPLNNLPAVLNSFKNGFGIFEFLRSVFSRLVSYQMMFSDKGNAFSYIM